MIVLKTPNNLQRGEIVTDLNYPKYELHTTVKTLKIHSQILLVEIHAILFQNESFTKWGTYLNKNYFTTKDIALNFYYLLYDGYNNNKNTLILIPTDMIFHYYVTGARNLK